VAPDPRLILASASPQRAAILTRVGIPFEARPTDVDELTHGDPVEVAEENARRKALVAAAATAATAATARGEIPILGADTLVTIDGDVLGKPADAKRAREYVGRLAGRAHEVVGAIALVEGGEVVARAVEVTVVRFRTLGPPLLDWYVGTGEWRGRAGGYAIQGIGAVLVAGIAGDYLNVVGLPLARLLDLRPDLLVQAG
jgi:septum formation protein